MRIWCKLFEKNHMLKDTVMENHDMSMSRTAKVYDCLERACYEFDLEKPMWLDKNKREFISHARTCFYQDNFIEHIDFDLQILVNIISSILLSLLRKSY